jgi:hypothetical protein
VLRIAILAGLTMGFIAGPVVAEEGQASFSVGVTIGKKAKPPRSATATLKYTWGAAAISVSDAGYTDIARQDEGDGVYWFTARKGESLYRIAVSARSGAIVEVTPA